MEEKKLKKNIKQLIDDEFDNRKQTLLVNTDYSTEETLIVSFYGSCKWFPLAVSTIEELTKVGYGMCEKPYPLIEVSIKDSLNDFANDLMSLKQKLFDGTLDFELPTFEEIVSTVQISRVERELSGAIWVNRYPGSKLISDLVTPFKEKAQKFYDALVAAGLSPNITATLRPKERAYLMKTSYDIAKELIAPENAPTLAGVNINWVHPTTQASVNAAKAMVSGYGIVYQPAYPTKHSDGTAIDMTVSWSGTLRIKQADGTVKEITSNPKDNGNTDLHKVAEGYGVYKLVSDKPHWSDNGH